MSTQARVLYIEDDQASRRLVQRVLGSSGYEVFLAADGIEGVTLAQKMKPNLILMDINLPNLDGRVLATRLRSTSTFRDIPIIALTANSSAENKKLALAAGCTGFLSKPIDVDAFPEQVYSYLHGKIQTLPDDEQPIQLERFTQDVVKQLEAKVRELEEANTHMMELTRLKSDFLHIASHEMQMPLLFAEEKLAILRSALDSVDQPDDLQLLYGLLDRMENGMKRMGQVVTEMIQASRVMSGLLNLRYLPVALHEVVAEVTAVYEDVCEKRKLCCTVQDLAGLPRVNGDYDQLKTAVDNLVSNAIKYTPDGGQVYITGWETDQEVGLAVRDTGMGVPEDQQEDIFELFRFLGSVHHHSTSKYAFQGGGLGLGLPMVKGIIEAHGGRIWVESPASDDKIMPGSKFTIAFLKSGGLR